MAVKENIPNIPSGVIGPIKADINVYNYKGIESESTKVTIDNRRKEIKVDVKEEFLDNKQDKLTAGKNIKIDENNVISVNVDLSNKPIPSAPTAAGIYTLQVVVDNDGNPTYQWVINN